MWDISLSVQIQLALEHILYEIILGWVHRLPKPNSGCWAANSGRIYRRSRSEHVREWLEVDLRTTWKGWKGVDESDGVFSAVARKEGPRRRLGNIWGWVLDWVMLNNRNGGFQREAGKVPVSRHRVAATDFFVIGGEVVDCRSWCVGLGELPVRQGKAAVFLVDVEFRLLLIRRGCASLAAPTDGLDLVVRCDGIK
jgi:hypothetical protein